MKDVNIGKYHFRNTMASRPERYWVYKDGYAVAIATLEWGTFTVVTTAVIEQLVVYKAYLNEAIHNFTNDAERKEYLTLAAGAIEDYILTPYDTSRKI